jgi:cystathionine beta-lyase/cystathionine gamma-synthase
MSIDHAGGPSTRAVHAGEPPTEVGAPVVNPIVLASTYFSEPSGAGEVRYQRYFNGPNTIAVAERLASLEGAEDALPFASGMSAMACALISLLQAGDHVVATDAIYGGTRALLDRELSRFGVQTTYVDFFSPGWEAAFRAETRVVLGETPSNPLLRVLDLPAIAAAAHARGATFVVDATFASPYNLRALEHGVDLVMHSATKYLGGHTDVTAGVLAGSRALIDRVHQRAKVWGPVLDGHGAWLLERGIKTLAVRMERHNANGMTVARWAEGHPGVARVHYPGLPSHPDHERARTLLDGFGGMLGLEIAGGGPAATRFVAALRLIKAAPSLGGVESLISEPRHTSHAGMTAEQRAANGIRDGFVRISLGIEDAADIIADIDSALAEATSGERSAAD